MDTTNEIFLSINSIIRSVYSNTLCDTYIMIKIVNHIYNLLPSKLTEILLFLHFNDPKIINKNNFCNQIIVEYNNIIKQETLMESLIFYGYSDLLKLSKYTIDEIDDLFIFASEKGQLSIVEWLYSLKIFNADIINMAILSALRNGHCNIISFLLNYIENSDIDINSLLLVSCETGYIELIKILLNYGVDINCKNEKDDVNESLTEYLEENKFETIQFLTKYNNDY